MNLPERRATRGLFPFELLDVPFGDWRPFLPAFAAQAQPIKVEDYLEDGAYVVRAELPGVDPAKDVEITVSDEVLRIHAERHEDHKDAHRSEFHYGACTRSIALPKGCTVQDVKASFDQGVLTVTIPKSTDRGTRRIAVG